MTMRRSKRYTVQSFKKKENIGDPYAMTLAPKGLLECPACHSLYHRKRWVRPGFSSRRRAGNSETPTKKSGKTIMIPRSFLCPACKKIRDGYAEGFITIQWPNWLAHKADVLNLIRNEENRACKGNPLERVMAIRERSSGVDIDTTTEHLAQRIGKHLHETFRGEIHYKWSHKDKLARIELKGPVKRTKARSK